MAKARKTQIPPKAKKATKVARAKATPAPFVQPFDPLAVENIGVTLAVELLEQPLRPLPPARFAWAGVYAIYYKGTHSAYADLLALDGSGGTRYPVYIGKALRENAKQGFNPAATTQAKMWERLNQHAESISAVERGRNDPGFQLKDFQCRYLVLTDAYISLAESVLITTFRPPWNGMGLGSKVVGKERTTQTASLWDSLHPGRGGRPAGNEERALKAKSKIAEGIKKLGVAATDPRTVKMLEKIKRFI